MNLLDYWAGRREHVLDFWREGYGIAALRKYVQSEIWEITIHALDALEIKGRSSEELDWVRYEFYHHFPHLPNGIDIVCALHPNPGVIYDQRWYDEETFQYNRYLPFLSEVIGEKAKEWAKVVLQFDDCLDEECRNTGGQVFVEKLNRYWSYYDYQLRPLKPLGSKASFPSNIYKFSSFYLFEKQSLEN